MKDNIKKQYPFQYYTIRNVDLLEQNGFSFDDFSFNTKHEHELYIGNINGLICRHSHGTPIKMDAYLNAGKKLTFLLPENYRECVSNLRGLRKSVTDYFDAPMLKNQITIITYKVDNSDIIDKVIELGKNMKFDCAIMNPPYNRSLHLKILEKVINFCIKTVNISPIRWLQDPLAKYKKNSDYNTYQDTISKKIDSLIILDTKDSNSSFDISNFGALSIMVVGTGGYDYTLPAKLRLGNSYNIIEKILTNAPDNIFSHCQTGINGVCVKVAEIRGFGSGNNFDIVSNIHSTPYTNNEEYIAKKFKKKDVISESCDKELFVSMLSRTDGLNFILSTRTVFFHFLIHCLKMDQHVPLKFLPFMQDYSQPWTDKRFCEFFNITGYISDTEAEPGSEWETILNEMKPYTVNK